jgi:hypothetical protein
MFSRYQTESDKLPPTQHALHFKIYRSHFVSFIWRSSQEAKPQLPNPEDYGWKLKDDNYEAIMTNQPPAPKLMCSCRSGCSSNRCM